MQHPAGILKNTTTGKFHPIVFRYAPRPSDKPDAALCRFRSRGHVTDGCDTLEIAQQMIHGLEWTFHNLVWEWDGVESSSMTWDFPTPVLEVV